MIIDAPRSWMLHHWEKPWTVNAERTWHYQKRASHVRAAREAFAWLAISEDIPRLDAVTISAVPLAKDRRGIQDVGACLPMVKAAVDGIVDAGIIPDDDPRYVRALTFYPTEVTSGRSGLRLIITEAPKGA